MASNIQVVIELLLKNKKAVEGVIEQLKQQYNIDIDTSDMDSAMSALSDHDIEISADGSQAEEAANDVEAEVEEIPEEHSTDIEATDSTTSVITAISTGYMALMQVIGQVKGKIEELVNLSGIQEKSEKLLQVSLANTGDASQETFERFKDLAASYQNLTTIGDETTMEVMRLGLNMGVMTKDLEKATKGAIGLSKSLDLDLKTAMKMHTLAMGKDFTMLQRYLPSLKTAKDDTEKMAIVKRAEANGWKLATSETEAAYGALEQYKNTAGDVKEKVGDLVMFALKPLISASNEYAERANEGLAQVNALIKAESLPTLEEMKKGWKGMSDESILSMLRIQETQIKDALEAAENPTIFTRVFTDMKAMIEFYYKHEDIILLTNPIMAYNKMVGKFAKKGLDKLIFGDAGAMDSKVNDLKEKLSDIQGAIDGIGTVEPVTDDTIKKVKTLSDELQALVDNAPTPKIKIEVEDFLDLTDEDEDLFEKEIERQSELLALKGDFAQRGYDLNTSIYQQQLDAIDKFYERKREDLIEAGLTEQEIVAQSEEAKDRVRGQYNKRALQGTSQALGNLEKAFRSQGKKGFKTAQNLAIAQAYMDMFSGAVAAYKSLAGIPFIGVPLGIAAAAAAIVAGKANIKQIKKQKFAGGGVVEEETEAIIGEEGPEAVVPLHDGKSIPVKNVGGDSPIMKAILIEMKAMNLNLVRQKKNITFIIETSDPETTVKLLNETEDRMTEANDV